MKFFVVVWIWVGASGGWEAPFSNTVAVTKTEQKIQCQSFEPLFLDGGTCVDAHIAVVMPADDNKRIPQDLLVLTCTQDAKGVKITLKCKE